LRNYTSFINNHLWTDLNGDGKVVLGAEQWPACLNPVTECANSSWMVWTTINQIMPGAFATTNDGDARAARGLCLRVGSARRSRYCGCVVAFRAQSAAN
jgi:hypothetical protein